MDETLNDAKQIEASVRRAMDTLKVTSPVMLGNLMGTVGLIEDWCKALRAQVEENLITGVEVPGYKLVDGRKGNRAWSSVEEAEATLKTMRVPHDQMYDYKVVSPTTAEKLFKAGVIGPRQWPKLSTLITQAEGKPSVAPAADKRPAISLAPTAKGLTDETPKPRDEKFDDLI